MTRPRVTFWRALSFFLLHLSCSWAADFPPPTAQSENKALNFDVFWPPKDPTTSVPPGVRPLLNGVLNLRLEHLPESILAAHLQITLIRPLDEPGRKFWNTRLAFPQYDWMRYVRVWDTDQQWLWPNLAYLLRLHGVERVERYGGVDPGKGVDNDFAAVLIRKFDASRTNESAQTKNTPLVSAEWYPVKTGVVDKQTIVHRAQSDEFTFHLGPSEPSHCLGAVWLIYADFMEANPPSQWPKTPEFAGGILAYFEIEWNLKETHENMIRARQLVPKRGTEFDWEHWAARTRAARDSKSTAKLSDIVMREGGDSKNAQPTKSQR